MAEHLPTIKPTSRRRYLMSLMALEPHFAGKFLDHIGRKEILDFIPARGKLVTASSVRRYLACLSAAFNRGIGWDYCDTSSETFSKRHVKENAPRMPYLSSDEYTALLVHAGDYLK